MSTITKVFFTVLLSSLSWTVASTPCDCSVKLGSCNAFPANENGELMIRSSTNQCSFVTYRLNGNPSSATVIDGSDKLQFLDVNGGGQPSLSIDSCEICRDSRFALQNAESSSNNFTSQSPTSGTCSYPFRGVTDQQPTGTYSGECRMGKAHGYGEVRYFDGGRRAGQFVDGLAHGQGTYSPANGSHSTGVFHRGWLKRGFVSFAHGSTLEGEFDKGIIVKGTSKQANGIVSTGTFDRGRLVEGRKTFPDGGYLDGSWKQNGEFNGTLFVPGEGQCRVVNDQPCTPQ